MGELSRTRIQLLGPVQVTADGRALAISSQKVCSLLAFLALRSGTPIDRDEIVAALWPDDVEATGRPRLRHILWKLRDALRPAYPSIDIKTTGQFVTLMCSPDVVDALRFRRLVTTSRGDQKALREAIDLYRGELLADVRDEWIESERYDCQALFLRATKQLLALLISERAGEPAMQLGRRAALLDPTDEEISHAFMQAALIAGEPAAALAQYDVFVRALMDDAGAEPGPQIVALFEQIRGSVIRQGGRAQAVPSLERFAPDTSTLIGRLLERRRLLDALGQLSEGRSALVVITGAPGVGKTRLADSVATEARSIGLPIYKGRCSDVPNPPPYQPILEALWPLLSRAATEESPVLATLLSTLIPKKRKRRFRSWEATDTFDSAVISETLLHVLAPMAGRPALLVFDDIHRADHASWAWLNSLIMRLQDMCLCVILTSRTGETELQDERVARLATLGAQIIALQPLETDEVRELVSNALQVARAPSALGHMIARYVGGNPLHVLEAIRLLKGRGLLRMIGDAWTVDTQTPEVLATLSSSQVSYLVQNRISLLPETTKDALSAAAILGIEMNPELLRALLGIPPKRFVADVERLIRHRMLVAREDAVLRFSHEEIRSAILDQITPIRRRWLHRRAAQVLMRMQSARPEDLYWHFHGAGDLKGALFAASSAGDDSYAVGEHASAIDWYQHAIDANIKIASQSDIRSRITLELKLERALDKHGNRPRQLSVLESVVTAAAKTGFENEFCEALIRQSLCLTRMNRRRAAIEAANQALELAHTCSDLHHEAHAYRALAAAHETLDEAEVLGFLKKALRLFHQLGATTEESLTLSELATLYERLGNVTGALHALDRAAVLVPHDEHTHAFLLARRASALLWTGRLSETYATLHNALTLLRRFGDRVSEARVLRVLGDAHVQAGRYRDALLAAVTGLQIAYQAKDSRLITGFLNFLLAGVYGRLGLIHRGEATYGHILELVGADANQSFLAIYQDSLSTVYLHTGKWSQARAYAEHALVSAAAVNREWFVSAESHLHLSHSLLELGDPVTAREHLLPAIAYYRSSGELPLQALATALMAVAVSEIGDNREAEVYLRESIRLVHRIDILPDSHLVHWLHGLAWTRLGSTRQANRAFRTAYSELSRVAASLGPPLRRRFLSLPFQRRVLEAIAEPRQLAGSDATAPLSALSRLAIPAKRSLEGRRQALLKILTDPKNRPNRPALAAVLGVTPRTITNDIAALRRAGHQIRLRTTPDQAS